MSAVEMLERALRFGFPNSKYLSEIVYVEKVFSRNDDYWVIRWGESRWSRKHQLFIEEMQPSSRTPEFINDTKYSRKEAYRIANSRNLVNEHMIKCKELDLKAHQGSGL